MYSRFVWVGSFSGPLNPLQTSFHIPSYRREHREATSSRWRWPNCPRSLAVRSARPFSPIFFKTLKTSPSFTSKRHSWSPLRRIWSLQSTAHLKPFLRNFFVYEKHVRYTPGSSNSSFQDLVMDFQRLFYTNSNGPLSSIDFIFFSVSSISLDCPTQLIELNPWIDFDWVRFTMPGSVPSETYCL